MLNLWSLAAAEPTYYGFNQWVFAGLTVAFFLLVGIPYIMEAMNADRNSWQSILIEYSIEPDFPTFVLACMKYRESHQENPH